VALVGPTATTMGGSPVGQSTTMMLAVFRGADYSDGERFFSACAMGVTVKACCTRLVSSHWSNLASLVTLVFWI
jgi:hypothetical protein